MQGVSTGLTRGRAGLALPSVQVPHRGQTPPGQGPAGTAAAP